MKVRYVFLLVLLVLVLSACEAECPPIISEIQIIEVSQNWTWISLVDTATFEGDSKYFIDGKVNLISASIRVWEESNPDREIVDVDIIYRPNTYARKEYVFGISIYSKLKSAD